MQPIADNNVWYEAQNTEDECIAISQAFGLGDSIDLDSFAYACLEDNPGLHTVGGGINPPLTCSTDNSCPNEHRTKMDNKDIPCGQQAATRSICPCAHIVSSPIPTLSEWGLIALAVVLCIVGIVGFMVIRKRKAAV